jgi:hypothetical protein
MATDKQVELFDRLTTRKNFGDADTDVLRITFRDLSDAEASRWIERALTLPDGNDSGAPVPF